MNTLFDIPPTPKSVNPNKCGNCKHYQRWEYPVAIILLICAATLIEHYGYKKGQKHSKKHIIKRKK